MKPDTPHRQAMMLIATYDLPDACASDRDIVRMAHKWMRILRSPVTTQGVVDKLVDELTAPGTPTDGGGWERLRQGVITWALQTGWLETEDLDPATGRRRPRKMIRKK